MEVHEAIEKRRNYRALEPIEIDEKIIKDLTYYASLAPSCYNKQPWRFIFIKSKDMKKKVFEALSAGNDWVKNASVIVAIWTKKEFDCVSQGREYALFDTGLATAFMVLRATELGLVASLLAGFDEEKVKEILGLDKDSIVISLMALGKHDENMEGLNEKQKEIERNRPPRLSFEDIARIV